MLEAKTTDERILADLSQAIDDWVRRGNEQRLTRWLKRELDADGAPIGLAIPRWHECLSLIAAAARRDERFRGTWQDSIDRLIQATLRFTRPDGSAATDFGSSGAPSGSGSSSLGARRPRDLRPGRAWLRERKGEHPPGAPEAWSAGGRVLAALRADGAPTADFVAIDHRSAPAGCRFELYGAGRTWLGPTWSIDGEATTPARPRPRSWTSSPDAALAEWTSRAGDLKLTRSVVLLRARRMAILSVVVETPATGPRSIPVRLAVPTSLSIEPVPRSRALVLAQPGKRGSAQVLPIALPCLPYESDRGALAHARGALVLSQAITGRRGWLPLVVSWDGARHRKELLWRVLTVSEKSRIVGPDRALAVRVSWGADETYVIYRSLGPGPPAVRAFLGYQTRARFLVGLFTADATIEPILEIT